MPLWLLLCMVGSPAFAHDYASFNSDGVDLAYTDYGTGEPVIILHGFQGSFEPWLLPIGDTLSGHFRVIGLDQRGHGRSGKPHEGSAYGVQMAADVLNLMDHLKLPKAHIVGHSMGGIVVMYLVANHPERFYSAVSIGNGLFSRRELLEIGWLLRGLMTLDRIKLALGITQAPAQPQPDRDEAALAQVLMGLKDMAVPPEQAAALRVPMLAVRGGEQDDPNDTVQRLVQTNPAVQMYRVESETHMSMTTYPPFLHVLDEFLKAHGPAPAP